jgi:hypothetical protein
LIQNLLQLQVFSKYSDEKKPGSGSGSGFSKAWTNNRSQKSARTQIWIQENSETLDKIRYMLKLSMEIQKEVAIKEKEII